LGADTGADGRVDRGNSDTMMLLTLNPKKKNTVAYSIPRDALAEMVGDKQKERSKNKCGIQYWPVGYGQGYCR
jgi:Transcriptional regulator